MESVTSVDIKYVAGECPVQAEGHINGKPFYFRARGDRWSIGIGGEPVSAPEWEWTEMWGLWPSAGYMSNAEATALIMLSAQRFSAGEPSRYPSIDLDGFHD